MYTLAIDTSTNLLSLALGNKHNVIAQKNEQSQMQHGVLLLPTIKALLEENQISINQISKIIIGIGPGSYTGIRIGVTAAKMWATSLGIPIYSVSSLALIAGKIDSQENSLIIPLMDARRLSAYTGIYQYQDRKLTMIEADTHADWESWLRVHREVIEEARQVILVGHQIETFVIKAKELYPDIQWQVQDDEQSLPYVSRAIPMTLSAVDDAHQLNPFYGQLTLAEREWLEKADQVKQDEALVDTTIS